MRNLSSIVLVICSGSYATASGLSEPEIISPLVGLNATCDVTYTATEVDYLRAYNHFTLTVGQTKIVAENSAKNMVRSHLVARKQTCNSNARAVTGDTGNAIRDGLGRIVLNLP